MDNGQQWIMDLWVMDPWIMDNGLDCPGALWSTLYPLLSIIHCYPLSIAIHFPLLSIIHCYPFSIAIHFPLLSIFHCYPLSIFHFPFSIFHCYPLLIFDPLKPAGLRAFHPRASGRAPQKLVRSGGLTGLARSPRITNLIHHTHGLQYRCKGGDADARADQHGVLRSKDVGGRGTERTVDVDLQRLLQLHLLTRPVLIHAAIHHGRIGRGRLHLQYTF